MKKKEVIIILIFSIFLFSIIFVSSVSINEFELNSTGTDSGNEWIELINLDAPQNLSAWRIMDEDGANYSLPGIIIGTNGFFVLENLTGLVNLNENLTLFNQLNQIKDSTGLFNDTSNNNETWSRRPDGNGNFTFQEETKSFPNEPTIIDSKTSFPSCIERGKNVTLTVHVTGFCIEEVIFNVLINDSYINFTGVNNLDDNYTYTIDSNLLNLSNSVNWTVYTRDCLNTTRHNGIETFYVNNKTYLNISPSSPDGINNWYITEPEFTLSNADSMQIFYRWDAEEAFVYSITFNLDDIPNSPPKESAGILDLHYWSKFSCGNETDNFIILNVDLTNPLITNLQPANGTTIYNILTPKIFAHIDEIWQSNSGINLSSIIMKLDDINVINESLISQIGIDANISHMPLSNLSLGQHNVSIFASDNSGRFNQKNWTFEIASVPDFVMTVYSPINTSYNKNIIRFNISLTTNVSLLEFINYNNPTPKWKKLCDDCDNYGFKTKKSQKLNEGENNITFRATGFLGEI
ncbi:MAG: hypothetical protein AABY07_02595, partial [Nanoarchaeota archaeon]